MDPVYSNEKSRIGDQPPAYQADMGYPSAPSQGVYPAAQGYGSTPYPGQPYSGQPYPGQPYGGAPAYPGQPAVTTQPTILVTSVTPVSHVPDYLGYSIFTLLCCCLPLGIAALIYSINTRDANMTGNTDLALKNSKMSRLLNNIALGIGIAFIVLYIIIVAVTVSNAGKIHHGD
ncbi:interferon-induced transmembrane protein 3 [Clarias gariepinus]|uniref:synapse differentiation-inducing gene protein 1-like n=1 Tax=Clarias gariepinus TaxID=13013 RepID=UPI00234C9136|nr:synapse differentiation-inducing gene protein 1-like [Clarias gariepinus]